MTDPMLVERMRVPEAAPLGAEFDWNNWLVPKREDGIFSLSRAIYENTVDDSLNVEMAGLFGQNEPDYANPAVILEPNKEAPHSMQAHFEREMGDFWKTSELGKKACNGEDLTLREYFEKYHADGLIFGAVPFAGLGHIIEEFLKLKLLMSATGVPSWMTKPEGFIGDHVLLEDEDETVSRVAALLKAQFQSADSRLHTRWQIEGLHDKVWIDLFAEAHQLAKTPQDKLKVLAVQNVMKFAFVAAGEDKQSQDALAKFSRGVRKLIDNTPGGPEAMLRFVTVNLKIHLTEAAQAFVIKKMFDFAASKGKNIILGDSSHALAVRAFIAYFPEYSNIFNVLIPDRGYYDPRITDKSQKSWYLDAHYMLTPFVIGEEKHGTVTSAPSQEIAEALKNFYHNSGEIVETGELLDSLTPEELAKKWDLHRNERNVALMVNGNATNVEMIRKSVLDFIHNGVLGSDKYNLAVCLFENDFNSVFGKEAEEVRAAMQTDEFKGRIRIIQSQNKVESAQIARYLSRWAHFRVGKPPGENAFMSAAVGCVEACGPSLMKNEELNMMGNLDKALPSSYPPEGIAQWLEMIKDYPEPQKSLAQKALALPNDNFLNYLNALEDHGYGRDFAINGYLRSEHLNTLHNELVSIAQMVEGKLTHEAELDIMTHMYEAQDRFNDHLLLEMAKNFGFSPSEVVARMHLDPEVQETHVLPNKYKGIYDRKIAEWKKDAENKIIQERVLMAGMIGIGAILAGMFLLLKDKPKEK